MPPKVSLPAELLNAMVTANRILVREQVLDAFGHVSVRDPTDNNVFWLAAALPPSRVCTGDMLAFDLNGEPVCATDRELFSERYIHSEIYKAREDVHSVCHHHAPSILPFCIGNTALEPVSQTGAFLGGPVPVWNSTDEFGDTRLLIDSVAQAASLAQSLGSGSMVLMRGHGATVVGASVEELVFKCVFGCKDADHQRAAAVWGKIAKLSQGEISKIGQPAAAAVRRAWRHWTAGAETRHDDAEGN